MLHFNTWGGGGWGDPLKRDAEIVAADVARGLVTAEGRARATASCVDADGTVDAAATERLRRDMASRARRDAAVRPRLQVDRGIARALQGRDRLRPAARAALPYALSSRGGIAERTVRWRAPRDSTRTTRAPAITPAKPGAVDPALILIDFAQAYFEPTRAAVRRRGLPHGAGRRRCGCAKSRMPAGLSGDPDRSHLSQGRRGRRRVLPQGAGRSRASWRAARRSASPTASSRSDDEFDRHQTISERVLRHEPCGDADGERASIRWS